MINKHPVIKRIIDQQEKGLKKYGTLVNADDYTLSGWAEHKAQELTDALVYTHMIQEKVDCIKKELTAIIEFSDDPELQLKLRNIVEKL